MVKGQRVLATAVHDQSAQVGESQHGGPQFDTTWVLEVAAGLTYLASSSPPVRGRGKCEGDSDFRFPTRAPTIVMGPAMLS